MGRRPKGSPPLDPDEAKVTLNISGPDAAMLRRYMIENGHSSVAGAFREILGIYFASLPLDGAVISARDTAMNNTKHWILTRLNVFMQELQHELAEQVTAIEKSGYGK
jgi:hypothetical protein